VPELLLEILSEEIPARMQARAADDLKRLVCDGLNGAGLAYSGASAYATPRRLALVVEGLPERQPDADEEKKGPKVGAPAPAIEGFLKANGLASIDLAEIRETDKGPVYFAVRHVVGQPSADVLPGLLTEAIRACPWPKSMRWAGSFRWVRPIHGILAVFAGEALCGTLDLGGGRQVAFGDTTRGHRFLVPAPIQVTDFADYEAKLRSAKVMLDREERKALIAAEAARLAKAERLTLKDDPALLDELTGLVEWPQVLLGRIDAAYMDLPPEVLTTTMRSHQKYLALLDRDGRLADRFAFVANLPARKGSKRYDNVVAGNERVLRARLADARFFWDQDRKRSLASRVPDLRDVIFHAKLGNLEDKARRLTALAAQLSAFIDGCEPALAKRAGELAKADLTTGMVGEFPELQGVMGRYYALADGEPPEVAEAIAEHYAPLGPNDRCPSAPVSVAVALADKIDTLVGFWMINEKPTGSKDPYALRRSALGAIRLVVENQIRLPLSTIIKFAYHQHIFTSNIDTFERIFEFFEREGLNISKFHEVVNSQPFVHFLDYDNLISDFVKYVHNTEDKTFGNRKITEKTGLMRDRLQELEPAIWDPLLEDEGERLDWYEQYNENLVQIDPVASILKDELLEFFADRLKVALKDRGVRHDLITAVFALGGEDDLVRLLARVDALQDFLNSEDGENLLTAYKRAENIVRIEEKRDGKSYREDLHPDKLIEPIEKNLATYLHEATSGAREALGSEEFSMAMEAMAKLRRPVDEFFDNVMVNTDNKELRANRLRLLSAIGDTLGQVADFSKIEA
jgi:glycyl-tRNA synthetase beta chain